MDIFFVRGSDDARRAPRACASTLDIINHPHREEIVERIRTIRRECNTDEYGHLRRFNHQVWWKKNRDLMREYGLTLEQWWDLNRLTFVPPPRRSA